MQEFPLQGLTVLDFGIYAAGPMSSMPLGDLGANVIRIEPVTGEPLRSYFRGYSIVNRGKRVIALNVKAPEGVAIVQRLCAKADIVHYNYRPGVAQRLGIDAPALRRARPEMIVLNAPGYGVSGPKANDPAFDMIMQAFAGHESRLGGEGNLPLWCRLAFVDIAAGLLGAAAILAALYRRIKTGAGAELSISLLDTAIFLMSELIRTPDGSFVGAALLDAGRLGHHPARSLYEARDGWLALALYDGQAAALLCQSLSLPPLTLDVEAWGGEQRAIIAGAIRQMALGEVLQTLRDAGIWAEACAAGGGSGLLHDQHLQALGSVITAPHPEYGVVTQVGRLLSFSPSNALPDLCGYIAQPGGDTRAILREYAYTETEIAEFYERGIIA